MSFKINQKLKVKRFCNILMVSSVFFVGLFLLPKTAYLANIDALDIINLTNQERLDNDLEKLEFNPKLKKASYKKAKFLLENQIFTHNTPERKFSDWAKDVDYDYSFVGENLAINFVGSEEVIKAWMESEGHKENILSGDYKEIGVSILEGNYEGHTTYLVVQMFGTKRGEKEVLQASSSSFLASNTIITSADNNIGLNDFKSIAILSLIKNNKPITLSFLIILLSILITSLYILIYSHLKEDSFGPSLSHHH